MAINEAAERHATHITVMHEFLYQQSNNEKSEREADT